MQQLGLLVFANTSRSRQNKKNPAHSFVEVGNMCDVSAKIIELWGIWSLSQFSNFQKNTWFFEDNRALSKFLYGILHYLVGIIKL